MDDLFDATFVHRSNGDRTFDPICTKCYLTDDNQPKREPAQSCRGTTRLRAGRSELIPESVGETGSTALLE